jgi:nucleoside-diphosphate-sugar epimerase
MSYVTTLAGRRVLVTGASGFVGGRLAERLVLECGAQVRTTMRSVGRAAALSRLPVEIALADLRDREATAAAVAGCDVVFHCARGVDGSERERRAVDVEGTRHLLDASVHAGVGRFVHTSTVVVYEIPPSGAVDERSRLGKSGDSYAVAKREAERIALSYTERLALTVLQPTVVYGPHAGVYGREILDELLSARIPLVEAGEGICNALYVDDLVTAMLLAATSERAPGETFLVGGPEYPTWAEFFGAFEHMLGVHRTVPMSEATALAHWKRSTRRPWIVPETLRAVRMDGDLRRRLLATREGAIVRRVAERVLPASFFAPERWDNPTESADEPEPPLVAFKPDVVRFLASTARVRIDKARELLGYSPVFGLADGMRLTEAWATWEGLVPERPTA